MSSFSPMSWIIFFGIAFGVYKLFKGGNSAGKIFADGQMICPHCGTRGSPKQATKGSLGIEIVLWLCLIVPGLIYSIWRLASRYPACPACGQTGMISVYTPHGKQLAEKNT
jgi:hypothetical protein